MPSPDTAFDASDVTLNVRTRVHGEAPLSGSFNIYLDGHRTQQLPADASAEQIAAALTDLDSVVNADVSRLEVNNGVSYGFYWTVTFTDHFGDLPAMQISDDQLAGDDVFTSVAVISDGESPSSLSTTVVTPSSSDSYIVDFGGLSMGVAYSVRVSAHNANGYGAPSYAYGVSIPATCLLYTSPSPRDRG